MPTAVCRSVLDKLPNDDDDDDESAIPGPPACCEAFREFSNLVKPD